LGKKTKMKQSTQPLQQMKSKPSVVWTAFDILFPPFCCNCGKLGYGICPDCFNEIEIIDQKNSCPKCGSQAGLYGICLDCQKNMPYYDQLKSWGVYSGVLREVIHKVKYQRGLEVFNYFTSQCSEIISIWKKDIDHIIPVPLSRTRHRSRGYNQAALIAKPISKHLSIPYKPDALLRIRDTSSQVGLNAKEREKNVLDAFVGDKAINTGKKVLVIDDITTTGSTLNECAKVLKKAGAKEVFCFTLARTPLSKNQKKNWRLNEQEDRYFYKRNGINRKP
jgi:ComF family protein